MIAFGGVETGSSKAHEAQNPIINGNTSGLLLDNIAAMGVRIEAAAVWLITLEMATVTNEKTMISK
jgi:hypothetical protein